MNQIWHIELFGGLRARQKDGETRRFQTSKTGALLACLAYHPRQSFGRDQLSELLWPDADMDSGRHSLRQSLLSLRNILEPPGIPAGSILLTTRTHVQLNFENILTDVLVFAAIVKQAKAAADSAERSTR